MKKPLLLLVDSSHEEIALVQQMLHSDYELETADSAEQALEKLGNCHPEMIITDATLVEMTGLELLAQLKDNGTTQHIPVIVTSQEDDILTKIEAFNGGAIDYVQKPFVPADFCARIAAHIDQARRQFSVNPLTKLPSTVLIHHEVKQSIKHGRDLTYFHVDLGHFSAYNTVYGYDKGDEMLLMLANLLWDTKAKVGTEQDFAGHLFGDDFFFITYSDTPEKVGDWMVKEFEKRRKEFVSKEDLKAGVLNVPQRKGEAKKVPVVNLIISALSTNLLKVEDSREVFRVLLEIHEHINLSEKSTVYFNKRTAVNS